MDIILCLVGLLYSDRRYTLEDEFEENIISYKKQFENYNVKIYLFTWKFNNDKLRNIISKYDIILFEYEENPLEFIRNNISNLQNRPKINDNKEIAGSYISLYNMLYLRREAVNYFYKKQEKEEKDIYLFLLRCDIYINFLNINNWVNNSYNTNYYRSMRLHLASNNISDNAKAHMINLSKEEPPHHEKIHMINLSKEPHHPMSDHISVAKLSMLHEIYNKTDKEISDLFLKFHNIESYLYYVAGKYNIIKHDEISPDDSYLISG